MEFAGANVVVVGMARSGLAAVELLVREGALVTAVDAKPLVQLPDAAPLLERLAVPFRLQSPEAFEHAEWIVISPGVAADLGVLDEARRRGSRVIGEVELAGSFLRGDTIGITGSNGKTTTTTLVGRILEECGIPVQVGGNIGTAAVTAMAAASRPGQWNVLELSSFQLETIEKFRARIGVVINVTPDHLDRHHTFESYAAAKGRLFETQETGDFAVLNDGDATCVGYAALSRSEKFWFSMTHPVTPGVWIERDRLVLNGHPFLAVSEIPLRGRHNVENVMAAASAAYLAGAPLEGIAEAVRTFPGVEHRLEFVRTVNGVSFFNDSKATNVDSALKAIDAFDGGLWVILGGKDKGSDYRPMRGPLAAKAKAVLLIGAATPIIADHLEDSVSVLDCGTLDAAVRLGYGRASAGDTVLLAPACASFDQFQSFEHRGRVFKEIVRGLKERISR